MENTVFKKIGNILRYTIQSEMRGTLNEVQILYIALSVGS